MEGKNKKAKKMTLDELARMMAGGFTELRGEMLGGFAELRGEMSEGFTELRTEMNARFTIVDKRINNLDKSLNYKIDQLDAKVEKYHHETKADAAALRGVVGGMSRTQIDHEKRLTVLEAK